MSDKLEGNVRHEEQLADDSSSLSDSVRSKRLVRAADLRILPLCAWLYLLNYLDRGNIGNARVLNQETHDSFLQKTKITPTQYAIVLSLFSIAYAVFEVPSNYIMKRYVRPSWWLAFLLFGWSCLTLGFTGVHTYTQTLVMRFFIGMFEAGFFPGVIYLITMWYRPEERSIRIAFIVASATLSGAFGGSIAYGMGKLNRTAGLEGFRWLFLIEGLISILSLIPILIFLPDNPARSWLSPEDAKYAQERLGDQNFTQQHASKKEILETVFSPRMMIHYAAYILDCVPLGSLTFQTPLIVTGLGYNSITAQLMTIPPWVVGYIVSLTLSYSADRFNARGYHIAFASTLGGIGWLMAGLLPRHNYTGRYGALVLASCGAFPSAAPMSAWVTCNVPSIATIGIAIALNNSGAGVSQVIAQWIWKANEKAQGYPTGNFTCAACSFAVALLALVLRFWYGKMNREARPDAQGKTRVWLY